MKLPVLTAVLLSMLLVTSSQAIPSAPHTPTDDWAGMAGRACGTPVPSPSEMRAARAQLDAMRGQLAQVASGGQIMVAFHVIYSGNEGNVPQSQIDAQIAELNKAYGGDYGGVRTGYTFVLASVDRINKKSWFRPTPGSRTESQLKNGLAIDPAHRLNIYTCKPGQNLLGWAYFPWSFPENNKMHGVVIHYGSLPGGYLAPYNLGGTADHEVGHYLGLYHTFQNGCSAPGDEVADTPDEATATSGCPKTKDTCPSTGADPIHNFMDYSTDACYTEFTAGQDARMDNIVSVMRPNLLDAAMRGRDATAEAGRPALAGGPSVAFRGGFPNPFRTETRLGFYLPKRGNVSLKIYNVAGQHVATLVEDELGPGEHQATLRAGRLPAGMYFAALRVDGELFRRTIVLTP